jgi:hypothetical protein
MYFEWGCVRLVSVWTLFDELDLKLQGPDRVPQGRTEAFGGR